MPFTIKRVYEPPKATDGSRVLVDRLWPRGLKKTDAHLDHWMKDVAPSPPLRQWFSHETERFAEFRRRYEAELVKNPAISELRELGKKQPVTLLYAAHDPEVNHAVVLLSFLKKRGGAHTSTRSRPRSGARTANASRRRATRA